jgi:hypothetical protein
MTPKHEVLRQPVWTPGDENCSGSSIVLTAVENTRGAAWRVSRVGNKGRGMSGEAKHKSHAYGRIWMRARIDAGRKISKYCCAARALLIPAGSLAGPMIRFIVTMISDFH